MDKRRTDPVAKRVEQRNSQITTTGHHLEVRPLDGYFYNPAASVRAFNRVQSRRSNAERQAQKISNEQTKRFETLNDLKKFSANFRLRSRIPDDLVPVLAKDVHKQAEIRRKADEAVKVEERMTGDDTASSPAPPGGEPDQLDPQEYSLQRPIHPGYNTEVEDEEDGNEGKSRSSRAAATKTSEVYPALPRDASIVRRPRAEKDDSEEDSDIEGLQSSMAAWTKTNNTWTTQPTTLDIKGEASIAKNDRALEENDDNESVRTDGSDDGLDQATGERLSAHFAVELSDQLDGMKFPKDIAPVVASHLYDYSCLMRQRAKPGIEHRATVFVRHRRNLIARYFETKHAAIPDRTDNMDSKERVHFLWNREDSNVHISDADIDLSNLGADDVVTNEPEFDVTEMPTVRAFLTESIEFQWLLSRIKVDISMTSTGDSFSAVRRQLRQTLEKETSLCFRLDWNPVEFLRSQYGHLPHADLANVICVVGAADKAQAITCGDYVVEVWPTMGSSILRCLDLFVRQSSKGRHKFSIYKERATAMNDTNDFAQYDFTASMDDEGKVTIEVKAEPTLLLEAGEVLCWLSVACQESPLCNARGKPCAAYCTPRITVEDGSSRRCEISHTFTPLDISTAPDGTCWHRLLRNPTVTTGYPVHTRLNGEPGLRIPLEMMVNLGFAPRVTVFDGALMLKGLCSMFVPVLRAGASIVWHYIVNADESWMPHTAAKKACREIAQVNIADLAGSIHYVGWTQSADILAGSKRANYDDIEYGGDFTRRGCALEGVTIGVSSYISANIKVSPGKKDTRLFQSSSGPYERTIGIATKLNVVFYDTQEDRAWLLDGASALIHLSRAALSHPDAPSVGRGLHPESALQHVDPRNSEYAKASDVLLDQRNRALTIWEDKTKPWLFEDLVLQHWSVLEEIKSHQEKLRPTETKQWEISNPFKSRLEGFGFVDIISGITPLRPRYATLSRSGINWIRATTETGAINILGANFGELMVSSTGCINLTTLPTGGSLLAAPVQNLRQMARMHGRSFPHSMKLCEGVFWNSPHESFSADFCMCRNNKGRRKDSSSSRCEGSVTEFHSKSTSAQGEARFKGDVARKFPSAALIIGSNVELEFRREKVFVEVATSNGHRASSSKFLKPSPTASSESRTPSPKTPTPVEYKLQGKGDLQSSQRKTRRKVRQTENGVHNSGAQGRF